MSQSNLCAIREDARDMAVRIGVGIWTPADQVRTLLARFDQEFFGARIVEQSFLRKHADFEIDRPSIVVLQSVDRAKAPKSDARVDLDMRAHAHGPLQDRFFQRAAPRS